MHTFEQIAMVALAGLLEGLGVPWPGAVVVAGAGIVAGNDLPDMLLLTAAFGVAYSVGALCQYGLGRLIGPKALAWLPDRYRDRLDGLLARHGLAAVFWTRPLVIGNYISAPAGIMRMPLRRFLPSTFFGICPWAFGILFAGDALGAALGGMKEGVGQYMFAGAAVFGCGALLVSGWKRRRRPESVSGD